MKLENKSVIVTGSGRGIGEYIAKRLAREGANAIVTRENSRLIQYIERARNFYGITVIERVPEIIYTKDYIEKNIGINVEYIDNFDEVLKYST